MEVRHLNQEQLSEEQLDAEEDSHTEELEEDHSVCRPKKHTPSTDKEDQGDTRVVVEDSGQASVVQCPEVLSFQPPWEEEDPVEDRWEHR